MDNSLDDTRPRRPATVAAIDARISVWGQAARKAIHRRAEALIGGAVDYAERVGRCAEGLPPQEVAAAEDPTPAPEEELPEYTDVLAPSIIEAIVGSNAAVKRCFAEAKARDEVVSGKIWVKFTVAPNGEVSKAHIVNSDLSGTDLDSCVSAQINRLQFAAFRGSTSKVVKYPFVVK